MKLRITSLLLPAALLAGACATTEYPPAAPPPELPPESPPRALPEYYGTLEPFAAEAVYFVVTDRFVDGDPGNNQVGQGGAERGTFDRPIRLAGEGPANIGYLGGDFRGILDNASYIADMGFTALWITPIVDNPDEAFTGSTPPGEGMFADRGKTGYHGYWGVNFFEVDEHLESPSLTFADLAHSLYDDYGIKLVLDIVCNHGSPAYTMPEDQPKFGELYDASGTLVADHQNLHPTALDPDNPLHAFFNREPDLAQLADLNDANPDVLEYLAAAYLHWIEQGARAFRIDTIKHMPDSFWKSFSDAIRDRHPDFFMFAESWSYDATEIARHTRPANGGISVLDFPGQLAMNEVFADDAPYSRLLGYLHLDDRVYENPYELMTFYDNHDMARMDADDDGFIDANNWVFTSRGIPVIYYGSEIGFEAGAREHAGNRNYFGQENVERARNHGIRAALSAVAGLRQRVPALQRGLQVNLEFGDDTAVFYRILRHGGTEQTALVLLNKSDDAVRIPVAEWTGPDGQVDWRDAASGMPVSLAGPERPVTVDAHGVRVLVARWLPRDRDVVARLARLQAALGSD